MNIFTNKDIGVLPFQMIKLAAGRKAMGKLVVEGLTDVAKKTVGKGSSGKKVVNTGSNIPTNIPQPNILQGFDAVLNLGSKQHASTLKRLGELKQTGAISQLQLDEILLLTRQGVNKADLENIVTLAIKTHTAEVSGKIPGALKLTGAATGGAALYGAGSAGVSYLANRAANKANAAGNAAAKEGELASLQNGQGGSWWDNTWNDIDKFREENPGLFYGGLGVGLLGGGYALSEMLDDDDDEEDEYSR